MSSFIGQMLCWQLRTGFLSLDSGSVRSVYWHRRICIVIRWWSQDIAHSMPAALMVSVFAILLRYFVWRNWKHLQFIANILSSIKVLALAPASLLYASHGDQNRARFGQKSIMAVRHDCFDCSLALTEQTKSYSIPCLYHLNSHCLTGPQGSRISLLMQRQLTCHTHYRGSRSYEQASRSNRNTPMSLNSF